MTRLNALVCALTAGLVIGWVTALGAVAALPELRAERCDPWECAGLQGLPQGRGWR